MGLSRASTACPCRAVPSGSGIARGSRHAAAGSGQGTRAKANSREPLRIGGNVLEAKLIHKVVPVYPPIARTTRVSGVVSLIGVIGK